jgi:hypothetical protein
VDPRNMQSYHERLRVFRKVMALKRTFECTFITFLRAPVDQDDIDHLRSVQQCVLCHILEESYFDEELMVAAAEGLASTATL